ncbi:hypothetical protein KIP69_03475 [Geobacter sulfurreducens]|uniref:hypothetical protein n=1 Tax=Geobacter sulfurreducens TaxID=35554 RepID=UPI001BDDC43C|nr:hypothetical protein [Geobacter sulfurreducens]QVW35923.1 hypothetical protein KIP69_03475 [Geobacter sulfurreducens]
MWHGGGRNAQCSQVQVDELKCLAFLFMELRGTHGTTRSRAEKIQELGFRASPGIKGTGVYFWRDNALSGDLARDWYRYYLKKELYAKDSNKQCAVIFGLIACDETNFVNLDDSEIKDDILWLIKNKGLEGDRKGKIYDEYLDMLSRELGNSIKVSQVSVPVPKEFRNFPSFLYMMADCYVVKDVDCVQVETVKYY